MALDTRRLVALGPAGCIYPGSPQDLRYGSNRAWLRDSGTRWVRLWADWPSLEPAAGQVDATRFAALDAQIAAARADGLKVVLTLYRFPTWANGTAAMTAEQLAATMPDRKMRTDADAKAKPLNMRYPSDVSESSAWGRFVARLCARYARTSTTKPSASTYIDVLEIANEPNWSWWPQQAPSTTTDPYATSTITIHEVVARMFVTAQAIQARYGGEPLLGGPGTADGTDTYRLRTAYSSFAERLLPRLPQVGFKPSTRFAWTHHNYNDVAYDQGAGTTAPDAATTTRTTNRAADARRRLVGRWQGWPAADSANPQLLITEGGVTLQTIRAKWGITDETLVRAKQADLLQRNWSRMGGTAAEGAGIAMVCTYLLHTDVNYDSGLCETPESGGAARKAYAVWRMLPSRQ